MDALGQGGEIDAKPVIILIAKDSPSLLSCKGRGDKGKELLAIAITAS
jgi:hypothetical protein